MAQSSSPRLPSGAANEIRLILLGRTGAGKSSFSNTVLDKEIFEADVSPNPITNECAISSRLFAEKELFVVDTPGFLDPRITDEQMQHKVAESYEMTAVPGPHAFLLVIEPTRFLPHETEAIKYLDKIFGSQAVHHTIIVFTHADSFRKTTIEQYLDRLEANAPLRHLVEQCNRRYITVNNNGTAEEKNTTVKKLLEMIYQLTGENNERVYRSDDFDAVAKGVAEEKSKGTYQPFKSDGTFNLLPQTKKIIIGGRFRRTPGRRGAES